MNNRARRPSPSVSVVLPVYNRAHLVQRAIRSVFEQTYKDFEIIVIDDGSTDDLARAFSGNKDRRLRIVSHDKNKGAAAARNTGISEALGKYIAFLDSDDYWLRPKLQRQLAFLRSCHGETRLSCTALKIFSRYHPEGEARFAKSRLMEKDIASGCRISPGSTLMAQKSLFDEVGPWNEDMRRLEDWEWLLRALKISNLAMLNEVLSVADCSKMEGVCYDAVKASAHIMRQRHFRTSGLLPSRVRLIFLGALENELAAAAYRNSRYGLALWHLFNSLCHMPYRNLDTIWRYASAVLWDSFHIRGGRHS